MLEGKQSTRGVELLGGDFGHDGGKIEEAICIESGDVGKIDQKKTINTTENDPNKIGKIELASNIWTTTASSGCDDLSEFFFDLNNNQYDNAQTSTRTHRSDNTTARGDDLDSSQLSARHRHGQHIDKNPPKIPQKSETNVQKLDPQHIPPTVQQKETIQTLSAAKKFAETTTKNDPQNTKNHLLNSPPATNSPENIQQDVTCDMDPQTDSKSPQKTEKSLENIKQFPEKAANSLENTAKSPEKAEKIPRKNTDKSLPNSGKNTQNTAKTLKKTNKSPQNDKESGNNLLLIEKTIRRFEQTKEGQIVEKFKRVVLCDGDQTSRPKWGAKNSSQIRNNRKNEREKKCDGQVELDQELEREISKSIEKETRENQQKICGTAALQKSENGKISQNSQPQSCALVEPCCSSPPKLGYSEHLFAPRENIGEKIGENREKIIENRQKSTENEETNSENRDKTIEHGEKLAENGKKLTENGKKLTENGEKMTENGEKMTENGEKMTENGGQMTAKERKVAENDRVTGNDRNARTARKERAHNKTQQEMCEEHANCRWKNVKKNAQKTQLLKIGEGIKHSTLRTHAAYYTNRGVVAEKGLENIRPQIIGNDYAEKNSEKYGRITLKNTHNIVEPTVGRETAHFRAGQQFRCANFAAPVSRNTTAPNFFEVNSAQKNQRAAPILSTPRATVRFSGDDAYKSGGKLGGFKSGMSGSREPKNVQKFPYMSPHIERYVTNPILSQRNAHLPNCHTLGLIHDHPASEVCTSSEINFAQNNPPFFPPFSSQNVITDPPQLHLSFPANNCDRANQYTHLISKNPPLYSSGPAYDPEYPPSLNIHFDSPTRLMPKSGFSQNPQKNIPPQNIPPQNNPRQNNPPQNVLPGNPPPRLPAQKMPQNMSHPQNFPPSNFAAPIFAAPHKDIPSTPQRVSLPTISYHMGHLPLQNFPTNIASQIPTHPYQLTNTSSHLVHIRHPGQVAHIRHIGQMAHVGHVGHMGHVGQRRNREECVSNYLEWEEVNVRNILIGDERGGYYGDNMSEYLKYFFPPEFYRPPLLTQWAAHMGEQCWNNLEKNEKKIGTNGCKIVQTSPWCSVGYVYQTLRNIGRRIIGNGAYGQVLLLRKVTAYHRPPHFLPCLPHLQTMMGCTLPRRLVLNGAETLMGGQNLAKNEQKNAENWQTIAEQKYSENCQKIAKNEHAENSRKYESVYLEENVKLVAEDLCVKVIDVNHFLCRGLKEQLRREIFFQNFCSHPNIVRIENIFLTHEKVYLVMELMSQGAIAGCNLFELIECYGELLAFEGGERGDKRSVKNNLQINNTTNILLYPENVAKVVCVQILDALHYLHKRPCQELQSLPGYCDNPNIAKSYEEGHIILPDGILHRDLKPANILIDSQGIVKLSDFGWCCARADESSFAIAGTFAYMAPEVLQHQHFLLLVDCLMTLCSIGSPHSPVQLEIAQQIIKNIKPKKSYKKHPTKNTLNSSQTYALRLPKEPDDTKINRTKIIHQKNQINEQKNEQEDEQKNSQKNEQQNEQKNEPKNEQKNEPKSEQKNERNRKTEKPTVREDMLDIQIKIQDVMNLLEENFDPKQTDKLDIWGLGACMFELLSGEPLFLCTTPPEGVDGNKWSQLELLLFHSRFFLQYRLDVLHGRPWSQQLLVYHLNAFFLLVQHLCHNWGDLQRNGGEIPISARNQGGKKQQTNCETNSEQNEQNSQRNVENDEKNSKENEENLEQNVQKNVEKNSEKGEENKHIPLYCTENNGTDLNNMLQIIFKQTKILHTKNSPFAKNIRKITQQINLPMLRNIIQNVQQTLKPIPTSPISQNASHLLQSLLEPHHPARLTAQQVIHHKWLAHLRPAVQDWIHKRTNANH